MATLSTEGRRRPSTRKKSLWVPRPWPAWHVTPSGAMTMAKTPCNKGEPRTSSGLMFQSAAANHKPPQALASSKRHMNNWALRSDQPSETQK